MSDEIFDFTENKRQFLCSEVNWVVNSLGELGVEIDGQYFFMYKGESLQYNESDKQENEPPIKVRRVGKREFGETQWPDSWLRKGRSENVYKVELQDGIGLPDNFDRTPYLWSDLPLIKESQQ